MEVASLVKIPPPPPRSGSCSQTFQVMVMEPHYPSPHHPAASAVLMKIRQRSGGCLAFQYIRYWILASHLLKLLPCSRGERRHHRPPASHPPQPPPQQVTVTRPSESVRCRCGLTSSPPGRVTIRLFFNIRDINAPLSDNEPQPDPACSLRKVLGLGGASRGCMRAYCVPGTLFIITTLQRRWWCPHSTDQISRPREVKRLPSDTQHTQRVRPEI